MIISLTGFMGCGKSSVGRRLSQLLGCPFMDLDDVIAELAGRSIPEIFASDGEAEFRRMERDALHNVIEQFPMCSRDTSDHEWHNTASIHQDDTPYQFVPVSAVLALGGGTVMTPGCAEMVQEHTLCIYLRASADTLADHLDGESEDRPMLSHRHIISKEGEAGFGKSSFRQRLEELMSLRSATYEKTAHIIIDTDGKSIDETALEIMDYSTATESRHVHEDL